VRHPQPAVTVRIEDAGGDRRTIHLSD
jgi:hypothetical protein